MKISFYILNAIVIYCGCFGSLNATRQSKILKGLLDPVQVAEHILHHSSIIRTKRQLGGFGFGSSSANANAFSQGFRPNGFGSSAANAQAQSFQSGGPLGSFGASAANAASQGFSVGPNGLTGGASFSGSQTYNLPGRKTLSIAYSNGFNVGRNGRPSISRGQSIAWS